MKNNEFIYRLLSSILILPITFYIIIQGSYLLISFLFLCFAISIYEWTNIARLKNYIIPGFIFLKISFYSAYSIKNSNFYDYNGTQIFLFIISICILTDIGGYMFGKTFKGPKLTKISPKKTVSGFIGGFIVPLIIFFMFYKTNVLELNTNIINEKLFDIIFFILFMSLISQSGDLIVSYFKRLSGMKHTGKLIPGHGGLLDRIDGMIFVFFISYFLYFR